MSPGIRLFGGKGQGHKLQKTAGVGLVTLVSAGFC